MHEYVLYEHSVPLVTGALHLIVRGPDGLCSEIEPRNLTRNTKLVSVGTIPRASQRDLIVK